MESSLLSYSIVEGVNKCIKRKNSKVEFFRINGIHVATFGLLIDIAFSVYLNVRLRTVV